MSRKVMTKGEELRKGDCLMSKNGNWKMVFQQDGNFVIYGWDPRWSSETYGTDATRLCMQEDCNLVMYNDKDQPRWHTNTYRPGNMRCSLTLTNEGKLVLSEGVTIIWDSTMNNGQK